jgi:hypothetical protein
MRVSAKKVERNNDGGETERGFLTAALKTNVTNKKMGRQAGFQKRVR